MTPVRIWGLSPPTRGSLLPHELIVAPDRSIPAHAGEPMRDTARTSDTSVYPRPRGGAEWTGEYVPEESGLSPPTRGSRRRPVFEQRVLGSIPAHAGEPRRPARRMEYSRVYPRPRGGALPGPDVPAFMARSIPAHAGEPGTFAMRRE